MAAVVAVAAVANSFLRFGAELRRGKAADPPQSRLQSAEKSRSVADRKLP
jgi:hypothetical protein